MQQILMAPVGSGETGTDKAESFLALTKLLSSFVRARGLSSIVVLSIPKLETSMVNWDTLATL